MSAIIRSVATEQAARGLTLKPHIFIMENGDLGIIGSKHCIGHHVDLAEDFAMRYNERRGKKQ